MTDKELLQQALAELLHLSDGLDAIEIIRAIRTRLAQPTPVGCIVEEHTTTPYGGTAGLKAKMFCHLPVGTFLYAAPSKKEWVGLTDGDVNYCVDAIYKGFDMKPKNEIEIEYFERVIKFVESKLKEKNT